MVTIVPLEDKVAQANLREDVRLAELFEKKPADVTIYKLTRVGQRAYGKISLAKMIEGVHYHKEVVPYEPPEFKPRRPRF